MIRQGIENRLTYLSGGVTSHMGMWPSAADWWDVAGETCVAAYQPKGAASLAASYTNLANPGTYDASPGVAPTWASATGWTFNGSTQYLDTGISPATDRSTTAIVRFSDCTADGGALLGVVMASGGGVGNGGLYLRLMNNGVRPFYQRDATSIDAYSPAMTAGVYAIAGATAYRDGSSDGLSYADSDLPSGTIYSMHIGRRNSDSYSPFYLTGKIQALAIYSTTLDATQISDLTTAMAAL